MIKASERNADMVKVNNRKRNERKADARKGNARKANKKKGSDFIGFMLKVFPSKLTGDPAEMARRYGGVRASGDAAGMTDAIRRKTTSYYVIFLFAFILAAVMAVQQFSSDGRVGPVQREGFAGGARYMDVQVGAKYGDAELDVPVSVAVQPEKPTPEETAAALEDLKQRLPRTVLGENKSLDGVTTDLVLNGEDAKTGAVISWRSDRPEIITDDGRVNLIEGKPGEAVSLDADITLGEATDELVLKAVMGDPGAAHDYARDLEDSVTRLVSDISGSSDGASVTLPDATESGIEMVWNRPREMGALTAVFVLPFIGIFVYRSRYKGMDKAVSKMRESIKRDFPDFLAKLLLLLNAGLVVTAAVAKIADDYKERRRVGEEKVFFEELLGMEDRIRGANTSLAAEFSDLAARSGQREVMRFSTILVDNIDKGSALADKLMQEEGMLRTMRKKRAEERGRLAETKLTFPMALQLGAIIIITVAPAAFEMQQ
ncbi:MAG: type II secretion system F family protein [Clostridiales Family XIII bacterium]|nr:type II secretion system F family protein [Clostridiales Family XIII bacterium]